MDVEEGTVIRDGASAYATTSKECGIDAAATRSLCCCAVCNDVVRVDRSGRYYSFVTAS